MKICPLKFNSITLDKDGEFSENTCQCEADDCAWFNKCFPPEVAIELNAIELRLDKMNKEIKELLKTMKK